MDGCITPRRKVLHTPLMPRPSSASLARRPSDDHENRCLQKKIVLAGIPRFPSTTVYYRLLPCPPPPATANKRHPRTSTAGENGMITIAHFKTESRPGRFALPRRTSHVPAALRASSRHFECSRGASRFLAALRTFPRRFALPRGTSSVPAALGASSRHFARSRGASRFLAALRTFLNDHIGELRPAAKLLLGEQLYAARITGNCTIAPNTCAPKDILDSPVHPG